MTRVRSALTALGSLGAALGAGACFSPSPLPGLGCADTEPRCPGGQVCDDAAGVCVPASGLETWRDDTAADFGDPTAVLDGATIEPGGAISPAPYFSDGVAIWGIDAPMIGAGQAGTASWDAIVAGPVVGRGFARGLALFSASDEVLTGTRLTHSDDVTVAFAGELYLDRTRELTLSADDRGFVEIYDPATQAWNRLAVEAFGDTDARELAVAEPGWFPIRGAYENDAGQARLDLEIRGSGSGGGPPVDVEPEWLRARVDALTGFALDGFDGPYLDAPLGVSLADYGIDALTYTQDEPPPGQPALGGGSWSQRFGGQFLVTVAGVYELELDSVGGHRLWIDGERVADTENSGAGGVSATPPLELEVGWHDLVLDWMKNSAPDDPAHLAVSITSGPELVGGFFGVDRLRPVIGRGARWAYRRASTTTAIADGGTVTRTILPGLPDGVTAVELADYGFSLTHAALATIEVGLALPGRTPRMVVAAGDLEGSGAYSGRVHEDFVDAGAWTLTVTDTTALDLMSGSLTGVHLASTYAGGNPPLATAATYTSRVRELGPVIAISGVRWQSRQGDVIVRVRSCDVATCEGVEWTTVAASGAAAGVAPRPYLQYQVEIIGDGDRATALDWIELDYRI